MNRYTTFMVQSTTTGDYPVIIAGICDNGKKGESIRHLSRIKYFECRGINDPYDIDYCLALYLKSISPQFVYGVGASIYIPGITESTGGIIGSPHEEINSAQGDLEYITEDLILYSKPKGPGFIIQGCDKSVRNILDALRISNKSSVSGALEVLDCIIKNDVGLGIIITDGSGAGSMGSAITYEYGKADIRLLK